MSGNNEPPDALPPPVVAIDCSASPHINGSSASMLTSTSKNELAVMHANNSSTNNNNNSNNNSSSNNPTAINNAFWQTTKTNLRERNKHMFNNDLISDVTFTVGKTSAEQRSVPAHRYVLGTASPVFFAMLFGDFARTGEPIAVEDCDYDSFLELVRFIYYDQVNLSAHNVLGILYLANKYIVPVLSKVCVDYLMENVQCENVLEVLDAAVCFRERRLEKHCWSILSRQTNEILNSESFLDIDKDLLINILKKDSLNVNEIEVFEAVKKWAERECNRKMMEQNSLNRKQVLMGILELVRFPVMSAKDFAVGPARSDLLGLEDIKSVFIYLTSGLVNTDLRYPLSPRVFKPHVCSRYAKPMKNYLWRYDEKDVDAIRFNVDQEIYLTGIGLYGSPCGGEYSVNITIAMDGGTNDDSLVCKKESMFTCPPDPEFNNIENPQVHQIMFDEPVRIKDNVFYDLCVLLEGPPSFAGDDGRHEVQAEGVKFIFENSGDSSNGTSFDEGQIPTLLFHF